LRLHVVEEGGGKASLMPRHALTLCMRLPTFNVGNGKFFVGVRPWNTVYGASAARPSTLPTCRPFRLSPPPSRNGAPPLRKSPATSNRPVSELTGSRRIWWRSLQAPARPARRHRDARRGPRAHWGRCRREMARRRQRLRAQRPLKSHTHMPMSAPQPHWCVAAQTHMRSSCGGSPSPRAPSL
jgi:hypothetical protein